MHEEMENRRGLRYARERDGAQTKVNQMSETIIGFDVGGSKIAVVEGGYDATIYQRTAIPDHVSKPVAETIDAMCAAAADLRAQAAAAGRTVSAISVSIGGPLDIERGIILSACPSTSSMTATRARWRSSCSGRARASAM
jgi:predicted NBD/HSP70 family sugar kinase